MMTISERQKLEREYGKWLERQMGVKACPLSVITFLDNKGMLITEKERENIIVTDRALDDACADVFYNKFPSLRGTRNLNFKTMKKRYKEDARKKLGR